MNDSGKFSVLIVDDHEMICFGIKDLFYKVFPRMHVYTANNSKSARNILNAKNINILITDLTIDEYLSGVDFVKQVRNLHPNLKIIVYSMHDNGSVIKHLHDLGINAYVTKQSAIGEMENAIKAICRDENYFSPDSAKVL